MESPAVLPPVLVPRHSEFAPSSAAGLLAFSPGIADPAMPHNVSYSHSGFTGR